MKTFTRLALTRGGIAVVTALIISVPLPIPSAQGAADAGWRPSSIDHRRDPLLGSALDVLRSAARQSRLGRQDRAGTLQNVADSPVYEQSIYIGYVVLGLTIVALWRRRRSETAHAYDVRGTRRRGSWRVS